MSHLSLEINHYYATAREIQLKAAINKANKKTDLTFAPFAGLESPNEVRQMFGALKGTKTKKQVRGAQMCAAKFCSTHKVDESKAYLMLQLAA